MLGAEAGGHRARLVWLGLALAATIGLAATTAARSTSTPRDVRGERAQERAEDIERLRQEIAAQVELNTCLIQLHARCETHCRREAERAHRPCSTWKADPAALAREAQMDELRALVEAARSRHKAEQAERAGAARR